MLPDISGHRRKPQMGESFTSMGNMGRMTGAAGFKRDSVSGRGVPNPGLTGFSYNDPNAPTGSNSRYNPGGATQTSSFGVGGNPSDD